VAAYGRFNPTESNLAIRSFLSTSDGIIRRQNAVKPLIIRRQNAVEPLIIRRQNAVKPLIIRRQNAIQKNANKV